MSITLGVNIAALRAQQSLNKTTDRIGQIFERLATGKRINRASDDPAGLAIATVLRTQQRLATVAIRNANDGISLVDIADGTLTQVSNILTRMSELAEQAANGVYNSKQRDSLQLEFSALASEIERLSQATSFNGINLLDGSGAPVIQVGLHADRYSQIQLPAINATLYSLGLQNEQSGALLVSLVGSTFGETQSAALASLDSLSNAIDKVASFRGVLGASEARLRVAVESMSVLREEYAAAESRIMDVDVAAETAELTRLLILQQVTAAVLAQANQQPALALTLLGR